MPNKRLRYAGKTYEVEPWGGAKNIDTPPTSAESSPIHKKKKLRRDQDNQEVVHRRFTDTMDGDTDMPEASQAASVSKTASNGSQKQSHETRIITQQPHYGLPDVTTVVLPFTFYFSMVSPASNASNNPTSFKFRLTSLVDIVQTATPTPAEAATLTPGCFNRLAGNGTTWPMPERIFPSILTNGGTTEGPQWRTWWARMYQAYTVLKTDYEIMIHNPRNVVNGDLIMAYGPEVVGTAEGKVYPNAPLCQAEHWPDIDFKLIKSSIYDDRDRYTLISGTYYPGKEKSHVRNDEDVSTWTKYTDPAAMATPNLVESMRLLLYKGPFNSQEDNMAVNIRVSLRITAQFRDLIPVLRHTAGQTNVVFTVPGDILQTQT